MDEDDCGGLVGPLGYDCDWVFGGGMIKSGAPGFLPVPWHLIQLIFCLKTCVVSL